MQIAKWGNSLAVRLPARMVQELGLKAGDEIEITAADARHFEVQRRRDPEEILARLRDFRGLMPKPERALSGEAAGAEAVTTLPLPG